MAKKRSSAKTASKSKKRRPILIFMAKISLAVFALIVAYGIYLDQQIRDRIDGRVWELPVAIYGQAVNLEPNSQYNKKEMIDLLDGAQYRQVSRATRPGEFVVYNNSIELLRRSFDFPDAKEPQYRAKLYFNENQLTRIQNMENGRDFGFFRIDPRLITMMQSPNGEQRLFMPLSKFPELLKETLIATEDRRFYQHDGVSIYSIGRALLANLTAGKTIQGGSTLTQQLVKNLFLTNERSYIRKIREAYMAVILDYRYEKDRILELYLNEVFLGQSGDEQIRGFPLASLYYFGRPVNELSLDQQALLVGMVKGASYYNPWRNPARALERRNVVLKLLQQQQIIDKELYNTLSRRTLGVLPRGGVISPQPAFMQLVRNELQRVLGDKVTDLSGMKIFTTFDPISQNAAEKAVIDSIAALKAQRDLKDLEAAMVVVNRLTGEVKAVVGGAQPQYAGFNRALLARRSIGSLVKPSTYLAALSLPDQYRLNTWLDDSPFLLEQSGQESWQPQNFDRKFRGRVLLIDGLKDSINIPAVNLGMAVGLESTSHTLQNLGTPKSAIKPLPARFLGAIDLTPLEVAQIYQTIGSGGYLAQLSVIRSVIDENGKIIYQSYPQARQAVSAQAAYLTLFGMQQAAKDGTAASLANKFSYYNLAAKTGTTNDMRDSWFVGIDGKDVAVTWVGLDNHQPMTLTGAAGALTIYRRFLENQPPLPLELSVPQNIQMMAIDEAGNFSCSGVGSRIIPVWTTNPALLCRQPEQSTGAPRWLKQMFGQ